MAFRSWGSQPRVPGQLAAEHSLTCHSRPGSWKKRHVRKTPKSQLPQVAHGKCGIHGIEKKKRGPKNGRWWENPKGEQKVKKKKLTFLTFCWSPESSPSPFVFCWPLPFFWGFMVKLQGSFHEFTAFPKDTATLPPTCRVSLLLPFLLGLFSVSINRFITRSSRLYLTMNSQMSGSSNSCSGLDKTVKPTVDSAKKDT